MSSLYSPITYVDFATHQHVEATPDLPAEARSQLKIIRFWNTWNKLALYTQNLLDSGDIDLAQRQLLLKWLDHFVGNRDVDWSTIDEVELEIEYSDGGIKSIVEQEIQIWKFMTEVELANLAGLSLLKLLRELQQAYPVDIKNVLLFGTSWDPAVAQFAASHMDEDHEWLHDQMVVCARMLRKQHLKDKQAALDEIIAASEVAIETNVNLSEQVSETPLPRWKRCAHWIASRYRKLRKQPWETAIENL